jgi:hypothetical protein
MATSSLALYASALFAYALLLIAVARAYRVQKWSFRPDPATLRDNCETYPDDVMRVWVARECIASIESNDPRLVRKGRYVLAAMVLVAADALLLSGAALVSLI